MKYHLLTTLAALSAWTALADAKSDLEAATKKLADAPNYAWTTKSELEGMQFTPAPIHGKADKAGFALLSSEGRDGTTQTAVLKGDKGAVKTDEGWKTADELQGGGGGGGGGRGRGGMLLRTKRPDAELATFPAKVKALTAADGAISGDLTEEGAKDLMTFGRGRPGGQGGGAKNARGSVKVWLKDGAVTKYQVKTAGTISGRDGGEQDIAVTRTVEIQEIGTTKLEIPADAKAKLGN